MGNAGGFITLYRKLVDWEWYKVGNTKDLFIHLLLTANFKDTRYKGIEIKRGQKLTSLTALSTETGMTIQQTRTALDHLKLTGEVTDTVTPHYRVITVIKYDDYQNLTDKSTDNQQTTNKQINKQTTGKTTANQQHNNNDNNDNNVDNDNNETMEQYTCDFDFDVFWNEYPKKVDKQAALKAWKKIKPDEGLMQQIVASVRKWKASDQWNKENGQYIPYPATWLNKRRWEDEVPEKKKTEAPRTIVNSAANFEQRDYSDVNAEMMRALAEEVEQARRDGIIK